jgi:predicted ester cyclase
VVGSLTVSKTHQGPLLGIAATGRSSRQAQAHLARFRDGKGVEHRAMQGDLGLMQQLGVTPLSNQSKCF